MKTRCILSVVAIAILGAIPADSIRIGGVTHKDVYVGKDSRFYYVHFPDEGRVEKISRARRDVDPPQLDPDPDAREAIRARFDAARARAEEARAAADATLMEADADAYTRRKAIAEFARFESQLAGWRALAPEQQQRVLDEVLALAASNHARLATERVTIQGRREHLDATRAEREDELARLRDKRDTAIERARDRSNEGFYREMHERRIVAYQQGFRSSVGDLWAREANIEAAHKNKRIQDARKEYKQEATSHEEALNNVNKAIARNARDAINTGNKARDAERRYAAMLARIDELILASQAEYEPYIEFEHIDQWSAREELRTPPITIEHNLWRLTCTRDDFGIDSNLKITVVDAETDLPLTAITRKDFLHQRTLVFERPGRFYFTLTQDSHAIPCEIQVSGISEPE
ncbi:MAG: hypothetical protein KF886_02800 [Candidatus Hydrogenedentes bacterium]|nr:hypothetical protein [Candidatus Hydrogenedentota bacterium]